MLGLVVIASVTSVLFDSPGGHAFESLSGREYCCFGVPMSLRRSVYQCFGMEKRFITTLLILVLIVYFTF